MNFKRIVILCGHYGSGKTNVALNLAYMLKKQDDNLVMLDLDIVNPYFRTKDSINELKEAGIKLIVSEFANSNVDIPALPQEMYAVTDNKNLKAVLDVGGDDRGALALGRLSESIISEGNYEMLMVINCYRPLTRDANSTIEVMREIEAAAKIKFTGLVNNSNLGRETSAEDVLTSVSYAEEVSKKSGLDIKLTTVNEGLFAELDGKIPNLFSMKLQKNLLI